MTIVERVIHSPTGRRLVVVWSELGRYQAARGVAMIRDRVVHERKQSAHTISELEVIVRSVDAAAVEAMAAIRRVESA